ncbi:uncharacterized protein ACHE_70640A [Aspergillus chevalieri]|uniref:Uncharacterized protein n=1 Tax=Aspergillus chevalieri TaxID=182096 RepID=A0A7R7VVX8_ASPCH|nr:uncharacterized protein ACHE_70640A [Aspergillus chevalieri]BCR91797.1 hypothetical protein ACHE_70640A [Aspergillus chevalieri]
MSLPKHYTNAATPSLSSSPRQFVRDPSRSPASRPQTIDRPPTTQPPEHDQQTYLDQIENLQYENDGIADIPTGHRQPFQPFFTLVEDANTGEYHHPTVHYIFSDDDTDILTEAAVRSLESEQDSSTGGKRPTSSRQGESGEDGSRYNEEDELSGLRKDTLLPPPIPGVRDSYIILDVEPTARTDTNPNNAGGTNSISTSPATNPAAIPQQRNQQPQQQTPQFTVTSAQSLTPAWQVLNTELVPAPTFENNTSGEKPLNGGLMLKIHGTPGLSPSTALKEKDKERGSQRLEDMMDQFAKRMSELRQVIEAGEHMHHESDMEQQQRDGAGEQDHVGDQQSADNDNNTTAGTTEQEPPGNLEPRSDAPGEARCVNTTRSTGETR